MKKLNIKIILVLIILLGAFLRVINLSSDRLPLYGDELTIGLDAYSLAKTAHDQTGQFLPLTFRMGAGRPAGYVYFSIPFVLLFGPGGLGVRGLSLLSGLGIILFTFLLVKKLTSVKIGLIA